MSIPVSTDSNRYQSKIEEHSLPSWLLPRDDQQGNESHGQSFVKEVASHLRVGLHRLPLLRVFLVELRSLVYRIALQYKRRYDLYGLPVGPVHQKIQGHLHWNIRTRACTLDMKSFAEGRLWATMIDWEVFRDAWARGAEWGEHNSYKPEQHNLSLESSNR
jgi:hypothetical protein